MPDLDYALNPYIGCYHACTYCYARLYTRMREVAEKWGDVVAVKVNLIDVLRKEAVATSKGVVGVGTITDPYQPVEATYKLTRKSLEILLQYGFKVSVQTKSPLVTRDLDLLSRYRGRVDVGFTITTLKKEVASQIEPRAPPPKERARALRVLSDSGIKTWVFYGPIIPGLNDDDVTIDDLLQLARSTNSELYYDSLHVKPFMLGDHPLTRYAKLAEAYSWDELFKRIEGRCREYSVECKPGLTRNKPLISIKSFFK